MDRRAFLGRLALVATMSLDRTGFAAALQRTASTEREKLLPPLDSAELRLIDAMAEGILPATDTPGARDAGVPEFIATLFNEWMLLDEQQAFRSGLAAVAAETVQAQGQPFESCTAEQQLALLERWDAAAMAVPPDAPKSFFRRFKNIVVTAYYTSQVGQEQELKIQFGAGQDESAGPIMRPPPFTI